MGPSPTGDLRPWGALKEVHRDHIPDVIIEERPPRLGRWLLAPDHVLGDGGFGNLDAQLQQLAMNTRRTCTWRIAKSPRIWRFERIDMIAAMRDCLILFVHLLVTVARLARPGGLRSVVAESMLVRHQLLILNRGRQRAPNLRATDRITAGLLALLISQARILRSAIVLNGDSGEAERSFRREAERHFGMIPNTIGA